MKLLFGGVIAVILLGLYAYAAQHAIGIVNCMNTTGCHTDAMSPGFNDAMTMIGGLVSALVIAELAVTQPGQAPAARVLDATASIKTRRALKIVTGLYLLVWVVVGLEAYVVGQMWYPGSLQSLTDLGKSWLGLAVAAGYAYFGIKQ